jgi:hypothetical protein
MRCGSEASRASPVPGIIPGSKTSDRVRAGGATRKPVGEIRRSELACGVRTPPGCERVCVLAVARSRQNLRVLPPWDWDESVLAPVVRRAATHEHDPPPCSEVGAELEQEQVGAKHVHAKGQFETVLGHMVEIGRLDSRVRHNGPQRDRLLTKRAYDVLTSLSDRGQIALLQVDRHHG